MGAVATASVRAIVAANAKLSVPGETVADQADLYQLGLTSHGSVNLMLALEDAFDIEFPTRLLRRSTFQSIASIASAIEEIEAGEAGA